MKDSLVQAKKIPHMFPENRIRFYNLFSDSLWSSGKAEKLMVLATFKSEACKEQKVTSVDKEEETPIGIWLGVRPQR